MRLTEDPAGLPYKLSSRRIYSLQLAEESNPKGTNSDLLGKGTNSGLFGKGSNSGLFGEA
jgi:hypothetical protein